MTNEIQSQIQILKDCLRDIAGKPPEEHKAAIESRINDLERLLEHKISQRIHQENQSSYTNRNL